MMFRYLLALLLTLGLYQPAAAWDIGSLFHNHNHRPSGNTVLTSIVNTTGNTHYSNGEWHSDMGPLTTQPGGLACDNTVDDMRYHAGEYLYWHIAPSDSMATLGMATCAPNEQGEPSCSENWHLCGRKVRVKCLDPEYCGSRGQPSLVSMIHKKKPIQNNYIPGFFVNELTALYGKHPQVSETVVLYITDFCPSQHSVNRTNNQCQGPQVDISTFAYLMMGKPNPDGYIDTHMRVSVELLPPDDPTPVGPESGVPNSRKASLQ
jgi:hypothetical protein